VVLETPRLLCGSFAGPKSSKRSRFSTRNASGEVALAWKEAIYRQGTLRILPCELRDLEQSWDYFRRGDLRKLSAVDATSFAIMKRARIRRASAFDHEC
jgi:predicted nucleic acid-binding protein